MAQPQMRRATESGVPDEQAVPAPAAGQELRQLEATTTGRGPGVLHHVAHGGDEVWTVRAGTQRQMDVYTIRKLCDIADQYAEGHVRFTIRSNIEFMVSSAAKVGPLIAELEKKRLPRRRHRQLGVDDRAHAGLAALRHPGHRRFRRREGADGRALRRVPARGHAQPRAPVDVLLRDQLRRPGRHRDHRPAHEAAEDQPRPRRQRLRASRGRRALPGRRDPPGARQRQAVARDRREEVHVLRRLLSAVPADADQRSRALEARDLGRRQELQRAREADVHEDGRGRACPTTRRAGPRCRRR